MVVDTDYDATYEVCIAGGGPVGTFLAARLAQAGVRVVVFEAFNSVPDGPRAISQTPSVFKEFELAGIFDRLKQMSEAENVDIAFKRVQDGQIMDRFKAGPKMPAPIIVPQKKLAELLIEEARRLPDATILFGHRVTKADDFGDAVGVDVEETESGLTHRYLCKYLVGADGSKSTIRAALGTKYEGETLPFKLLAADVVFPFEDHGFGPTTFLLDPDHFGLVSLITKTGPDGSVWRVSTGFPIEMSDEDIRDAIPAKFRTVCSEMKPSSYKILKADPYKAHQFCTTTMRVGRLMIVGDAAHLANPYSGQSLATGILDASSLAQCLISIIKRNSPQSLLDQWNRDRLLKFKQILDPVSRSCLAACQHPNTESIAQRHPLLKAMRAGPGKGGPPPSLTSDVTKFEGWVPSESGDVDHSDDRASVWTRT